MLPRWGGGLRSDDISEVTLYRTVARTRTDTLRQDAVDQWSLGLWGETEVRLTERLQAIAGLRAEYFEW